MFFLIFNCIEEDVNILTDRQTDRQLNIVNILYNLAKKQTAITKMHGNKFSKTDKA